MSTSMKQDLAIRKVKALFKERQERTQLNATLSPTRLNPDRIRNHS